MFNRFAIALFLALALAGCSRTPAEVRPALWQVEGPKGEKAWLIGTIHALPEPVQWKSAKVAGAMKQADVLVLEVASILSNTKTQDAFASLAQSPNLPPLSERVPPDLRDELNTEMRASGYRGRELDHYETWAAMLMFQQAAGARNDSRGENGIDVAIAKDWSGPVAEFEGAFAQLRIFDQLPEAQQRALLSATLRDLDKMGETLAGLQQAWGKGDVDYIAAATEKDFNGQPELRDALVGGRNRAWTDMLVEMLGRGSHPFVAVGAAHLAGKDGLPALLAAKGYKVTRLQ